MAPLVADKPGPLQHLPEAVTQHAIWASNYFVGHLCAFCPFRPRGSIWQFDAVGVLLIPLVFLSKDFFESICLPVGDRLISKRRRMIDDEVVAACDHVKPD
jgi:hypothetical protein